MRWRSFTVEQARPLYEDREASAALLLIHLLRSSVLTDFATVIAVALMPGWIAPARCTHRRDFLARTRARKESCERLRTFTKHV